VNLDARIDILPDADKYRLTAFSHVRSLFSFSFLWWAGSCEPCMFSA